MYSFNCNFIENNLIFIWISKLVLNFKSKSNSGFLFNLMLLNLVQKYFQKVESRCQRLVVLCCECDKLSQNVFKETQKTDVHKIINFFGSNFASFNCFLWCTQCLKRKLKKVINKSVFFAFMKNIQQQKLNI